MAITVLKQTWSLERASHSKKDCRRHSGCGVGVCNHQWTTNWVTETCLGVSHFDRWASHRQTVFLKWTSNEICPQELIIKMQQAKWMKLSHFSSLCFPFVLYPFSFSQDVPKDYRHVSLTGVKQRFEDEAYQHISKEKVLDLFIYLFIIADQGKDPQK